MKTGRLLLLTSASLVTVILLGSFKIGIAQEPTKLPQLVLDAKGFTDPIRRLVISNDGRWLAGAAEKVVRVWDLKGGVLHATLRGYQEPLGYHVGFIDSLAFSPDSRFLVVGVSDNFAAGSTRVYDLENPKELKSLVKGHLGCTRGVAFSPDGSTLATWGCDGEIIVYRWDSEAATGIARYRKLWRDYPSARPGVPSCFQFTENGEYLIFSQLGREMAIRVQTGESIAMNSSAGPAYLSTYGAHSSNINLQRPEGFWLANSSDPVLRIDQTAALRNTPWMIRGETLRQGKDSKYLASLWSGNGERLASQTHTFHIVCTTFNRDAGLAASADILGNIHVWDLKTGASKYQPISAHSESIWSVFWDESTPDRLNFATDHLPKGAFDYNNYGGIDHQLDISRTTVLPAVHESKRYPRALNTNQFRLHRSGDVGKIDLVITDERGTRSITPLGPADALYSSPSGKQRFDALGNAAIRLPSTFGEITFFVQISYPAATASQTYLLGSKLGGLVEGYIDRTSYGREFRITKKYIGHTSQITGADVSADGQLLATSSLDGTIRIWRLKTARQLGDVDFTPDGTSIDYIPTGGESERAGLLRGDVVQFLGKTTYYQRIREIQKGNLLAGQKVDVVVTRGKGSEARQLKIPVRLSATPDIVEPLMGFFLARDGEWVLWNDAGYYNSSSNGAQYIGWHVNNARNEPASFYPSDQFQQSLYQPKVVMQTLRFRDSQKAATAVLGTDAMHTESELAVPLAVESQADRYVPPDVTIVTPARNAMVRESLVSIRARVRLPQGVDVREARMFIDGRSHPTPLAGTRSDLAGDSREVWFEQDFDLGAGTHRCKLVVKTSVDTSASSEVQFEVQNNDQTQLERISKGRLFVLAIGISKYDASSLRLDFADHDAEQFIEIWKDRGNKVFSSVNTQLLTNSDASVQSIKEDGLNWVLDQNLNEDDTVIIFLAGHGLYDRFDEWYFGGRELDLNRLSTTAISDSELTSFFSKLPTNTIMFLDSCYSGQFEMPAHVSRTSRTGKNLWRGEGKIVLSSCLPGESSFESAQWQHGAFTKAILDCFTDPQVDYNHDGELGCLELIQFVEGRVRELTDNQQHPSLEFSSGISDVSFGPVGGQN
jgi:WD40 repeat protein